MSIQVEDNIPVGATRPVKEKVNTVVSGKMRRDFSGAQKRLEGADEAADRV